VSGMTGERVSRLAIEKAKWEGGRGIQVATLPPRAFIPALLPQQHHNHKFSQTRSRFDAIISEKQTVALSALLLYWISIARIPW